MTLLCIDAKQLCLSSSSVKLCTGEANVILCVLPATADIATQGALKIAKGLDLEGKRTVGVYTKIDLMPVGMHRKLQPRSDNDINLKLGFVGVGINP